MAGGGGIGNEYRSTKRTELMGKVRPIENLVAAANDGKRYGIAYFYITNHHDIVAGWGEGWKQYDMIG